MLCRQYSGTDDDYQQNTVRKDKTDFMDIFELSGMAADNCLEELSLLKSGKKLPFPIKEEDLLFWIFFRYINEVNGTVVPAQKYDDLEIDERYDGYIECDYWDFVVMAIRKWKLEKELHAALTSSLALYDCEDMVVFVEDAEKAAYAKQNENIILESLQKYADSCVRRIEVAVAALRR